MTNLEEIKKQHQAGEFAQAKSGYLAWLVEHPDDSEALHLLGVLCAGLDELDEALEYLSAAHKIKPQDAAIALHLSNVLRAQNKFDKAEKILLDVLAIYPEFSAGYNNLGTIYFAQEQWRKAQDAYQHAINIQADYADAYFNLGLTLIKLKQFSEAANVLQSLLVLSPEHPGALFQLGRLFMEEAQYEKASEYFSVLARKHPFHLETQTNLATCLLKMGRIVDAQKSYLQALELAPDDVQILFNLGVISVWQNQLQEAIQYYQRILKIQPNSFDVHNNLGGIYMLLQNREAATMHFKEAVRIQPDNATVKHTLHILSGKENLSTSPPEYISSLFDSYASHYDQHLTQVLHYQVPELFYKTIQTIEAHAHKQWDILDLGCGTGLCGEMFKPYAKTLVGVDLSEKMLELAEQRHLYDELVRMDILTFLKDKHAQYDLILAGDVMVYFGEAADLFSAITSALRERGLFIFNTEISTKEDFAMTSSGRFVHHKKYLERLAKQYGMRILHQQTAEMRLQNNVAVLGYLCVLQKQP